MVREIEQELEDLAKDGHNITKMSMVGYSLGGLIARYAIGLLDSKGIFDTIRPVNFTTFASPHLGVRTPRLGFGNQIWNGLGGRMLSTSGRQLFTIDSFRDTGRPLLSILADPQSIFISALAKFENRVLYCNSINDRSAVYYTTAISRTDPYVDIGKLNLNYVPGYEPVVLDSTQPYTIKPQPDTVPTFTERAVTNTTSFVKRVPLYLALCIAIPLGVTIFSISSVVQTIRSRRRILIHESSHEEFGRYRDFPLLAVRRAVEETFESVNQSGGQQYLPEGASDEESDFDTEDADGESSQQLQNDLNKSEKPALTLTRTRTKSYSSDFPTLALTSAQFAMTKSLDEVGWRKYAVHIHNSSHSHAAIIVRANRKSMEEGHVVIRHWLEKEFKI